MENLIKSRIYKSINLIPNKLILNENININSNLNDYLLVYLEDIISFRERSYNIFSSFNVGIESVLIDKLKKTKNLSRMELKKVFIDYNDEKNFDGWITPITSFIMKEIQISI